MTFSSAVQSATSDFAQAVAALFGAAGLRRWLLERCLPPRHETARLAGCRETVNVRFDRCGVPHIQARNAHDLFFTQGYCHARDRLWQLELNRRTARGELAELFGARAIDLDRILRRLGFRRNAEREAQALEPEERDCLEAYTAGVNAWLSRHAPPVEYGLLRAAPTPWRILDTLAFARYMAWNLTVSWESKLIRWQLSNGAQPDLPHFELALNVPRSEWLASGGGSNNWVVAPQRSTTGRALLANDPHLRPRMPGAWYMAHLQAPGWNVIGASMPGLPGIVIGHNERVAWGITAAMADAQDLYLEQAAPNQPRRFRFGDTWEDAEVQREEIRVRGRQEPVIEEVVRTRHGPLLNGFLDVPADGPPLSLRSVTDDGRCSTLALLHLNRAHDWPSFRAALRSWAFPALNFVYADVDGVIAYKLAGRIPLRARDISDLPAPGHDAQHEWQGEVPFDDLPEVVNPPTGFWSSANQEPALTCPHYLSADWMDGYRQQRIGQLAGASAQLSPADCERMQNDLISLPAREIARRLCARLSATEFPELQHWQHWDGGMQADSVPAAIYAVFRRELVRRAFRDWPASLHEFLRGRGVNELLNFNSALHGRGSSLLLALLDRLLMEPAGTALVADAFRQTLARLRRQLGPDPARWHWGRLHRIRFGHVLGLGSPLLERLLHLSRGPYPIGGDIDTIAQSGVDPWHPFVASTFTVSYRVVFDVGHWDAARFVLPGGQSGQPGSPHYDDLLPAWRQGDYRPLWFSEPAVARATTDTIQLRPGREAASG
ncbi:MAG: penicillin acylase family protein [Planctomycetia bacterium]|nr:penicillin acylase family protein [Planctomycetia bacterium]